MFRFLNFFKIYFRIQNLEFRIKEGSNDIGGAGEAAAAHDALRAVARSGGSGSGSGVFSGMAMTTTCIPPKQYNLVTRQCE